MTPEQIKLVLDGEKLIGYTIIHHYKNVPVERDDMRSIARMGLIKAAQTYNPELGCWRDHAIARIRSEIQHYVRYAMHPWRMPEQPNDSLDRTIRISFDGRPIAMGETIPVYDKDSHEYDDLYYCMQFLLPRERECIIRYFWYNQSQREIAEKMGVHQMTISRCIRSATTLLKELLEEQQQCDLCSAQ